MSKRTDIHSPSNFIPEDYRYVMSFCNGQNKGTFGFPINNDLIMELRQTRGRDFVNIHGGNYDCDVCGKIYNEGECWEHVPTGQLITLGHTCARKYDLCADDAEFEREKAQAILARKRQARMEMLREDIAELYSENPGLEDALKVDHYIVRDIAFRLEQYGNLSEKQISLVFKIQKQIEDQKKQEQEFIDVPTAGRQDITGTVVAGRWEDSYYGYTTQSSFKALILVDTPEGQWKTWGTIPTSITDEIVSEENYGDFDRGVIEAIKNRKVTLTATVKIAPNDSKMSFFSRPSKGKLLK